MAYDKTEREQLPNIDQILKDLQKQVGKRLVLSSKVVERMAAAPKQPATGGSAQPQVGCPVSDICIVCDQRDFCRECDALDWCSSVDTHVQ
jgi:hypothetical protein